MNMPVIRNIKPTRIGDVGGVDVLTYHALQDQSQIIDVSIRLGQATLSVKQAMKLVKILRNAIEFWGQQQSLPGVEEE